VARNTQLVIHANVGNNSKSQRMNVLDKIYFSIYKYGKFILMRNQVTYSFFMLLMFPLFATILCLFTLICFLVQHECNFFLLIFFSSIGAFIINISISRKYFHDYKIRYILSKEYKPTVFIFLFFLFASFTISIIGFALSYLILTHIKN
jgi:hypothetical protein